MKASTNRYYLSTDGIKSAGDVQLAGSRAVPVLEPGVASDGNRVAAGPATLAPGAYHLIVCADDAKGNTEVDETNNCSAAANATLQVALPDLTVTFVTGQPLSAKVGSRFSVVDSIANLGAVSAPASTTRIYLSKDTIKGPGDVIIGSHMMPALSPSGQAGEATSGAAIATIPISTAPGAYHVIACADDTNLVTESSEADNCRAVVAAMQVTK